MAIHQRAKPFRENWLQIDTLRCGMDWSEEDLERPQILVDDVFGYSHPGSFHLDSLSTCWYLYGDVTEMSRHC